MFGGLINTILEVLTGIAYPGIVAVVGLESAGLPLPGETTLLAASYLASVGQLSLPLVIGAAALGAVVGDSVGYFVGRKGGRRLLERYGRYVGITQGKLEKADGYFPRHGGKTVFFGRFVGVLRVLAGPLAGASNMPYQKFLAANAAGAVAWATTMGALSFFFGKPVATFLGHLGIWTLVALTSFLVLRFPLKRWRRRGQDERNGEEGSGREAARERKGGELLGGFGGITGGLRVLIPLLYWGGLVRLLTWVVAEVLRGGGETARVESVSAKDLLHALFARGKIDAGEYERALKILCAQRPVVNDGS